MFSIKINLLDALKIATTKKEFILYNLDNNDKITNYSLCNDLRNRKKYQHFKLISCIKVDNLTTIKF